MKSGSHNKGHKNKRWELLSLALAFFLFFSPLPDIIGTSVLPCGRKEGGKN